MQKAGTESISNYLPLFCLSLLLIILPSYSPIFSISYNAQRAIEIAYLALSGIGILFFRSHFQNTTREIQSLSKNEFLGIAFIFFVGIISATFSSQSHYAFLEVGLFALLFLILFFIIHLYKQDETLLVKIVLVTLALSALLYLVNVTLSYINTFIITDFPVWPHTKFLQLYSNGEPVFSEPFLGFVHVRYLNHLHTWSLPLFALMVVKIQKKYWTVKYCTFALSCFWWMLVFTADARGTMLGSFSSLVFVAFLFRKKIIEWLKAYAGGAAFGLILYLFFFKLLQSGGRTVLSRYSDSGRMQMWENAFQLIWQNPILGVGPMNYANYANDFRFAAPHNIYLQIASEWGLVVFITLAVLCVSAYIAWIKFCKDKINDKNENTLKLSVLAALTASITAAAIHGFFTGIINTPLSQLLMVLVLGWTIGLYQKEKNIQPREIKGSFLKWININLKGVVLVTIIYVSGMTYYSYKHLDESRGLYLEQSERQTLYPRFWDHGIIGVEEKK